MSFKRTCAVPFVVSLLAVLGIASCAPSKAEPLKIPRGYHNELVLSVDGKLLRFGPFVGYYFRPFGGEDLTRLSFLCFNERNFYTRDVPENALLYKGTAVQSVLPETDLELPAVDRINPVFFSEAPEEWLQNRPEPSGEYLHFHSCYSGDGPVLTGYWLSHNAVTNFVYDMGGRLAQDSMMYHEVRTGPDTNFPRIIEFDAGPKDQYRLDKADGV